MDLEKTSWFAGAARAAKCEVKNVLFHPWEVFACVVMPVVWCVLIAGLLNQGLMRELPFGLVDEDRTALSADFARTVDALPSVRLIPESREGAEEDVKAGREMGTIVIPDGWSAERNRSEGKSLELHISRTVYAVSTTLELDIKKALLSWSKEAMVKRSSQLGGLEGASRIVNVIEPYEAIIGNPGFNYRTYLGSALIPMLLGLAAVLSIAGSLVREWRQRRVGELIAASGSPSAAIVGKLLPWLALYTLYMTGYITWFAGFEGHAPAGSLGLWVLAGAVYIGGLAAYALLFSACAPTWVLVLVAGVVTTAPTIPFTGFSYPTDNMSTAARVFSDLLPLTWYLKLQAQQWVLASPLAHYLVTLGKALLFIVIPSAVAFPILCRKMKGWARREAQPEPVAAAVPDNRRGFFRTMGKALYSATFNPNTIAIVAGGIAFYLVFYGWAYQNEQITKIPTAIVDLDGTATSRNLIRSLDSSNKISVAAVLGSEAEAQGMMRRQEVDVAVLIPRNYASDLGKGTPVKVGVYGNGAYPAKARAVFSATLSVSQEAGTAAAARLMLLHGASGANLARSALSPPALLTENLFNKTGGYRIYMVPMVGVLIIQSVMLIFITLSAGEWIASKRWPGFLENAAGHFRDWAGLYAGFALVTFAWILYAEGFYFGFMEFSSMKNFLATLLLAAFYAAAIASYGLLIVFCFGSNHYTTTFVALTSAPNVFLAGCIYPGANFSWWARAFSMLTPSTPAINGMLAASQNGASTASILPYVLHLAIIAVLFGALARFLAKKRLSQYERGISIAAD